MFVIHFNTYMYFWPLSIRIFAVILSITTIKEWSHVGMHIINYHMPLLKLCDKKITFAQNELHTL